MKKIRLLTLILLMLTSLQATQLNPFLTIALNCNQMTWPPKLIAAAAQWEPQSKTPGSWHTADRPLLRAHPTLKTTIPWLDLADLPTPVIRLKNLAAHFSTPHLYIKNDGLTQQPVGGNKIRKLELLFADALAKNVRHIITFGCAGSNHATSTAYHSKTLGLSTTLLLCDQPNSATVRNNLLIDYVSGAEMIACGSFEYQELRALSALHTFMQATQRDGQFPYLIPTGASCPLGGIGYVNAIFELKEQIDQGLIPEPDYIYCAAGSVGTVAGMLVGLRAAGLKTTLIPVGVEPNNTYEQDTIKLAQDINGILHERDASFPLFALTNNDITFNMTLIGPDYGVLLPETHSALQLFATKEHISLDQTYTGKAAAALIADLQTKPELHDKVILFWNTFGIQEQTFKADEYKQMPLGFHTYFETNDYPLFTKES